MKIWISMDESELQPEVVDAWTGKPTCSGGYWHSSAREERGERRQAWGDLLFQMPAEEFRCKFPDIEIRPGTFRELNLALTKKETGHVALGI